MIFLFYLRHIINVSLPYHTSTGTTTKQAHDTLSVEASALVFQVEH